MVIAVSEISQEPKTGRYKLVDSVGLTDPNFHVLTIELIDMAFSQSIHLSSGIKSNHIIGKTPKRKT